MAGFPAYVGGLSTYIARCSEIVGAGDAGFRLTVRDDAVGDAPARGGERA